MRIIEATSEEERLKATELLRAFLAHQRVHYAANRATVERYFDPVAYEYEVTHQLAFYSTPGGCVLLALEGEVAVGVVCLKRLDESACEMKRLFVPTAHRRKGIAHALTKSLFDAARDRGYSIMRLDTGTFMVESQALYRKMGFRYRGLYQPVPDGLRDQLVYMEIDL